MLPHTLTEYLKLLNTIEQHGLLGGRLKSTAERLQRIGAPLIRFSLRSHVPSKITEEAPFPDEGFPLQIRLVRFGGPNEPGHAGLEFRGYGGVMRLNTLKNLQPAVNRFWHVRDHTPGSPVWSQRGTITIDPEVHDVAVTDDNDPEYGTWAGDVEFCPIRDTRTGEIGMMMKEAWNGGTVLMLTNLDDFLKKLRDAHVEIDYALHK